MEIVAKIHSYLEQRYSFTRKGIRINERTLLLEEKIIDSIGMLEMISFVEETFNIEIPDKDISPQHFGTTKQIAAYIDSRQSQPFP